MTGNLASPMADEPILTPGQFAAAQREAGIRLAGIALRISGGDRKAAGRALLEPLVAIGLLPYKPGAGKYHWGQAT